MSTDPHDCQAFERHLEQVLSGEAEPAPLTLSAARACPRCAPTLHALATVLAAPNEPEEAPSRAVEAQSARLASEGARRGAGLAAAVRLGCGLGVGVVSLYVLQWDEALSTVSGARAGHWAVARAVLVSVAAVALVWRSLVRGERQLFLRWQGHQVNGVCTGLAHSFGLPVWAVRLAFVVMFVAGLGGGSLYLTLAFALTFSAEEREHLWRFRVRRLWGRLARR